MFTRLLVVACVSIIVALLLYFFYWNRFIAFIIGQLIRLLYWNQEASSIWVEIGVHLLIIRLLSVCLTMYCYRVYPFFAFGRPHYIQGFLIPLE